MRKPERQVQLDDILSSSFFTENYSLIDPILRAHLALEAILVEIIQIDRPSNFGWKLSFIEKTAYLVKKGIIDNNIKECYDKLNEIRNDVAHKFAYLITPDFLLTLAKDLELLGIEFSDSIGYYSLDQALEYYTDAEGILAEILWCILFDAASHLQENEGRDIFDQLD